MGNSICLPHCEIVSHSSIIPLLHYGMSHSALFRGMGIRNSGNKVKRGLKLEL